jgi:CubicO group peptidase (beta-lactamase class C family)
MRRLGMVLVAFLVTGAVSRAATIDDETRALLPHVADEVMVEWGVPGMSIAVVKRDGLSFIAGFGVRDIASKKPVTPQTLFAAGSITKAFTALSLGLLVEDGLLRWDHPVGSYLPDFQLYDRYASLHATPRDLLTHQTGVPRHDLVWYGAKLDLKGVIARLRFLEPQTELHQRFIYTNLMYLVAGDLIEHLSGAPWEEFVTRRVLQPLGMKRSYFGSAPASESDRALPYRGGPAGAEPVVDTSPEALGPAGGLVTCAEDMARWLEMLLVFGQRAETPVASTETVREMFTPQAVIPSLGSREMPIASYGMGWFVQPYRGTLMVWHGGDLEGTSSLVALLPFDGLGIAVLTNRTNHQAPHVLARWLFDRALGLPEIDWQAALKAEQEKLDQSRERARADRWAKRHEGTEPSAPLDRFAGRYLHPAYGEIVVELAGEQLHGRYHGMEGVLKHFQDDVFVMPIEGRQMLSELLLLFNVDTSKRVVSLSSPLQDGVAPILFTREDGETATAGGSGLAQPSSSVPARGM